jgi:hypothetical protein
MNQLDLNKFKTCKCGTNVNDIEKIDIQHKYTWVGWFFWSMGTTATPTDIIIKCKACKCEIDHIQDRQLIKYYNINRRY